MKELVKQIEKQYGYKLAFISKTGSSNYLLSVELSDIDYVGWVYPNKENIYGCEEVFRQHLNLTYKGINIDLQLLDIRKIVKSMFSCDPMYLEQLYVDHYIDDDVKDIMTKLIQYNYSKKKIYKGIKGLAYNHNRWLSNKEENLNKKSSTHVYYKNYGINSKSLSNLFRAKYMIKGLYQGKEYSEVIILKKEQRKHILDIKENKYHYTEQQAEDLGNELIKEIDSYKTYFYALEELNKKDLVYFDKLFFERLLLLGII